jgi:hypothetical protein
MEFKKAVLKLPYTWDMQPLINRIWITFYQFPYYVSIVKYLNNLWVTQARHFLLLLEWIIAKVNLYIKDIYMIYKKYNIPCLLYTVNRVIGIWLKNLLIAKDF